MSKKAFFYSLLIHGGCFLALFLFLRDPSLSRIPKMRGSRSFEVTLQSPHPVTSSRSQTPAHSSQNSPKRKNREVPQLKDLHLGIASRDQPVSSGGGSETKGGGANEGGAKDGFETAQAMGLERETNLYPFFHALWVKINASTGYPPDFVHERISGIVNVHLSVNRQGVFTGKFLKVDSDSIFLKTYVMALLVHALEEPLPEKRWADQDEMILVTQFDFKTFTYGEVPREPDQSHMKNLLYFKRDGYADPKLKETIERFFTRYVPPIIPLPGAFYIDFVRAYELVRNLSHPERPDPDEIRKHRMQISKEEWQRVIKKVE